MNVRLATMNDLPQLKVVYEKIIDTMNKNNIQIWDEIYPYEVFGEDIENDRLYVLVENNGNSCSFCLMQ
ncbi:hypothetical protein [uncultured Sphaerochaeta sp.]|uniref:hypothetical protein n=1 Tax=uncultured Sphaerochaeta sp. TaxID=886478 RepID=UPI002A0A7FFA|nr:hypothetical protein [uncultured Sphaerochaeta sp.]